jgi:hypothetical protein
MVVQGYDYVQMQYSNAVTLPVSPYDIGTGSWFYLDPAGGTFQSNTTGTLETVVLGNDGSVSTTGNINIGTNYYIGNGSQLTGISGGGGGGANIANGTSNVTVVSSGGNVSVGVGGTGNVAVFATTGEYVTGLISANGNITGGNILATTTVYSGGTQVLTVNDTVDGGSY